MTGRCSLGKHQGFSSGSVDVQDVAHFHRQEAIVT